MIGKIFGGICFAALLFGCLRGTGAEMATAVLNGAENAVQLVLTLSGMMGLWCGVLRVWETAGVIRRLARILRRPLAFFFPKSAADGEGMEEICANIAANLLGVGNAATPMALQALKKMQKNNKEKEIANADMITLTVLNTCPLTLIPSTLLALRQAAGASRPFEVVVPIWICSTSCALLALLICRGLGKEKNLVKKREMSLQGQGKYGKIKKIRKGG